MANTGIPLGIEEDAKFEQGGPVTLRAGDIVLIGTDGIWEAFNASGRMYGKERLNTLMGEQSHQSAEQIASAVVESVLEFSAGAARTDDITLLVIKCTGPGR